jgi:hypothetical protein
MKTYMENSDNSVCGNAMVTNRPSALPCHGASWSVSLNLLRTSIAAVLLLAALAPCCA